MEEQATLHSKPMGLECLRPGLSHTEERSWASPLASGLLTVLCVSFPDCEKVPGFSSEPEKVQTPSAAPLTVSAREPRPLAPLRGTCSSAWAPGAETTQEKAVRGFPLSVFAQRNVKVEGILMESDPVPRRSQGHPETSAATRLDQRWCLHVACSED